MRHQIPFRTTIRSGIRTSAGDNYCEHSTPKRREAVGACESSKATDQSCASTPMTEYSGSSSSTKQSPGSIDSVGSKFQDLSLAALVTRVKELMLDPSACCVTLASAVKFEQFKSLTDAMEGVKRVKLALREGELILIEFPTKHHERAIRALDSQATTYNGNDYGEPLTSMGSVTLKLAGNVGAEPDNGFYNMGVPPELRAHDDDNEDLPSIVMEIGVSEHYRSLSERAREYLVAGVAIVIVFKFNVVNGRIQSAFCWTYDQGHFVAATQEFQATQVISFGSVDHVHHATKRAVAAAAHIEPLQVTGVGCGGPACDREGLPDYMIRVPAEVIWLNVPAGLIPPVVRDWNIDLFKVKYWMREFFAA
jgi:Uma2 family endonuclease